MPVAHFTIHASTPDAAGCLTDAPRLFFKILKHEGQRRFRGCNLHCASCLGSSVSPDPSAHCVVKPSKTRNQRIHRQSRALSPLEQLAPGIPRAVQVDQGLDSFGDCASDKCSHKALVWSASSAISSGLEVIPTLCFCCGDIFDVCAWRWARQQAGFMQAAFRQHERNTSVENFESSRFVC